MLLADLQATGALPAEWETAHPQARCLPWAQPTVCVNLQRWQVDRPRGEAPTQERAQHSVSLNVRATHTRKLPATPQCRVMVGYGVS